MSEQRIDHAAAAATGADADPGDGQGLASDALEGGGGAADDTGRQEIETGARQDRTATSGGDTEGERVLRSAEES